MSYTKEFKVAAVSLNTNSFGLHGVIVIARDGEAWDLPVPAGFHLQEWPVGRAVKLSVQNGFPTPKPGAYFEVASRREDAPPKVIELVWNPNGGAVLHTVVRKPKTDKQKSAAD